MLSLVSVICQISEKKFGLFYFSVRLVKSAFPVSQYFLVVRDVLDVATICSSVVRFNEQTSNVKQLQNWRPD